MVNIGNLVNMFTQKSGIAQSTVLVIINTVIQYVNQELTNNISSAGKRGNGRIKAITSALSVLSGSLKSEHPLVKEVQEKASINDPQKVTLYTRQAIDFINQEASVNPQGIESLFGDTLAGIGEATADVGGDTKKGLSGLFKNFFGSKK